VLLSRQSLTFPFDLSHVARNSTSRTLAIPHAVYFFALHHNVVAPGISPLRRVSFRTICGPDGGGDEIHISFHVS